MTRARGKGGRFIKSGKKSGKGGGCGKDTCTCGTGGKKVSDVKGPEHHSRVAKGGVVDTITMSTGLMDAFDAIELDLVSSSPSMKPLDELLKLFIMFFARKLCGLATGTGGGHCNSIAKGGAMGGRMFTVGNFINTVACVPSPFMPLACPMATAANVTATATGLDDIATDAAIDAGVNMAVSTCESLMGTIADKLVGLVSDYIEGADEKLQEGLVKLQQAGDLGQGALGEVRKILGVIRGVLGSAPLMLAMLPTDVASKVSPVLGKALEVLDKVEPAIETFASGDLNQLRAIISGQGGRGGAISNVGNQVASVSEVKQKPTRSSISALTNAVQGFPTGSPFGQAASHGTYAINTAGEFVLKGEDIAQAVGLSAVNSLKHDFIQPVEGAVAQALHIF